MNFNSKMGRKRAFCESPQFRSHPLAAACAGLAMTSLLRVGPAAAFNAADTPSLATGAASADTRAEPSGQTTSLQRVLIQSVAASPLLGSGIDPDKMPNATRSFKSGDLLVNGGQASVTNALQAEVGSVNLNATFGNPYQPDLTYRGFVASPVVGVPQGFAVYQNGVRINEAFGDTVNFDLIPDFAIHSMDLTSTNPVFGFNALGGALALEMNTGFNAKGLSADVMTGAFGRKSGVVQYGHQHDDLAVYVGANSSNEKGWRERSPSHVDKLYGDIGFEDESRSLHLSVAYANNSLNAMGQTPAPLLAQSWGAGVDYPGLAKNTATLSTLRGNIDLTDTVSIQGNAYYRDFVQRYINGTMLQAGACVNGNVNALCTPDGAGKNTVPVVDQQGAAVSLAALNGLGLGSSWPGYDALSTTSTAAKGGAVQAVVKEKLFGYGNFFVVGASLDRSRTHFSSGAQLGAFDAGRFLVPSSLYITSGSNISNVNLIEDNTYSSVYLTDTFDVDSRLSVTASARYNRAALILVDQLGGDLSGRHHYGHLNPALGLTYRLMPEAVVYANVSESNRVPSAAELSCASPTQACTLASFFVADPDLQQVVAKTYEFGIHSTRSALKWNVSLYRTGISNDIIEQAAPFVGRGYFQNDGNTRRQGLEAGVSYQDHKWKAFADYSYVAATFQSALTVNSPFSPRADALGHTFVRPGDVMPGVPKQRLKLGIDAWITPQWAFGAMWNLVSSQVMVGGQGHDPARIPGYGVVGVHTEYKLTPQIDVYGMVENLFDRRYYGSGTFTNVAGIPPGNIQSNVAAYTPAQPIGAWIGMRAKF